MKKLYAAALGYMIAGLLSGIYYREITKAMNFSGESMLSVLHTHLLILGMFFFLILISLEKLFHLSTNKRFSLFFLDLQYRCRLDDYFDGDSWNM